MPLPPLVPSLPFGGVAEPTVPPPPHRQPPGDWVDVQRGAILIPEKLPNLFTTLSLSLLLLPICKDRRANSRADVHAVATATAKLFTKVKRGGGRGQRLRARLWGKLLVHRRRRDRREHRADGTLAQQPVHLVLGVRQAFNRHVVEEELARRLARRKEGKHGHLGGTRAGARAFEPRTIQKNQGRFLARNPKDSYL